MIEAVGDKIVRVDGVQIAQLRLPADPFLGPLFLPVEFRQNRHLDRRRLRKHMIGIQQKGPSVCKIQDGHAHRPVQASVRFLNTGFELLP